MKHVIVLTKSGLREYWKDWSFDRIEAVLHRMKFSYWEIGIVNKPKEDKP